MVRGGREESSDTSLDLASGMVRYRVKNYDVKVSLLWVTRFVAGDRFNGFKLFLARERCLGMMVTNLMGTREAFCSMPGKLSIILRLS